MAKRKGYEGSAKDRAEDARGAKALGVSKKAYEGTARDRAEDRRGGGRLPVPPRRRTKSPDSFAKRPAAPVMPGPHEFSPDQERAMRQPAPMAGGGEPDADDFGI